MKIHLKTIFFSLLLIFILLEKAAYSRSTYTHSKYYKNTEINITSKENSTYVVDFNSYSPITPPQKMGEFRFTEEQLNEQSKVIAYIRYGLDFYPLWKAEFEKEQLKFFTEFRKDETKTFDSNRLMAKYVFKMEKLQMYDKWIEGERLSEKFEYDFSGEKVIKKTSLIDKKAKLVKKFQFNGEKLERVNVYNHQNSKEKLLYYYKMELLKSTEGLVYRGISYFNEKNIEYEKLTEVYESNRLIRVDFDSGYSIFYFFRDGEELTLVQANRQLKSITTAKYRTANDEVFPLFAEPKNIYLVKYEKIDFANRPSQLKYSWVSHQGLLNKEIIFHYLGDGISKIQKRLYSSYLYELFLKDDGLVFRKNIYNPSIKLSSYYLYRYNERKLLLEESLFDSKNDLQKRVKYFYHPTNAYVMEVDPLTLFNHYPENSYFFSYRGIEKDVKERLLNREVDYRHRPKATDFRKKFLGNLMTAHKTQLKKIIYYNKKNDISSYIRITSKQDSINKVVHLKIYYYDRGIDFKFKQKKDWDYYQRAVESSLRQQKNVNESPFTNNVVGGEYEFHHLAFDGANRHTEINREYLTEIHAFYFDENDIISFSKEILNSRNGKTTKKEGFSPDKPYFEEQMNSSHENVAQSFIDGLIDE